MVQQLASAARNYGLSALIARRAVREARKVRHQGSAAVAGVVMVHQIAEAQTSQDAIAEMLAEQKIDSIAEALLNVLSFTTAADDLDRMLAQVDTDFEFDRLVDSIVQDAARAAESVSVAVREDIGWVRYLNLPSCSRCVQLAGRLYRYSDGFLRHPGDDCSTAAVKAGDARLVPDIAELVRSGQVTGLSKADKKALAEGADYNRVVNARGPKAGLQEAGHSIRRGGRPTPAGIYRLAGADRSKALELLRQYGYIT